MLLRRQFFVRTAAVALSGMSLEERIHGQSPNTAVESRTDLLIVNKSLAIRPSPGRKRSGWQLRPTNGFWRKMISAPSLLTIVGGKVVHNDGVIAFRLLADHRVALGLVTREYLIAMHWTWRNIAATDGQLSRFTALPGHGEVILLAIVSSALRTHAACRRCIFSPWILYVTIPLRAN